MRARARTRMSCYWVVLVQYITYIRLYPMRSCHIRSWKVVVINILVGTRSELRSRPADAPNYIPTFEVKKRNPPYDQEARVGISVLDSSIYI